MTMASKIEWLDWWNELPEAAKEAPHA